MRRMPALFPIPMSIIYLAALAYGAAWVFIGVESVILRGVTGSEASTFVANASVLPFSILKIAAGAFGVVRALRHPALSKAYMDWLVATPWQHPKPLPLAPVLPCWQDLVLGAVLVLVACIQPTGEIFLPLVIYVAAYEVAAMACMGVMKMHAARGAHLAILMSGVALWPYMPGVYACIAVGAVSSVWILHLSLRRFSLQSFSPPPKEPVNVSAGFPFDQLSSLPKSSISYRAAAILSLFLGWYAFCVFTFASHVAEEDVSTVIPAFIGIFGAAVALGRLVLYCDRHASPLPWWARLWTGNLLFWKYDRVYVGSILVMLSVGILPFLMLALPWTVAGAICVALMFWAAFACGPTLQEWRLTCPCRITPGRKPIEQRPQRKIKFDKLDQTILQ